MAKGGLMDLRRILKQKFPAAGDSDSVVNPESARGKSVFEPAKHQLSFVSSVKEDTILYFCCFFKLFRQKTEKPEKKNKKIKKKIKKSIFPTCNFPVLCYNITKATCA